MALSKCPECGMTISDSAITCPNCGCDTSAYFEEIKKRENQMKAAFEDRENQRVERAIDEKANYIKNQMTGIHMPEFPKLSLILTILFAAVGIAFVATGNTVFGISLLFIAFFACMVFCYLFSSYKHPEKYYDSEKERIRQDADRKFNTTPRSYESTKPSVPKSHTDGYRCPSCGAMAGHPVSMVSKAVSVELMGLASNKIGKSYKCAKCGYMW